MCWVDFGASFPSVFFVSFGLNGWFLFWGHLLAGFATCLGWTVIFDLLFSPFAMVFDGAIFLKLVFNVL